MNLIVAVDKNWAIGKNNKLLVQIPADQRFFRETTMGKVVVMGRNTLESFPNGDILKNRTNIVLTTKRDYKVKGGIVVHSIKELMEVLKEYPKDSIYVIGGESIYKQMLPYCETAHITKIEYSYEADTYFPNIDELKDWKLVADSEEQTYYDLEYSFCKYIRIK